MPTLWLTAGMAVATASTLKRALLLTDLHVDPLYEPRASANSKGARVPMLLLR